MSLSAATTSSPTSVDCDYLTLDHFAWADTASTKRKQVDEMEYKRRHRETQRRYLQRKRARIAVLQATLDQLEVQFELLQAQQETTVLSMENAVMRAAIELDTQCEGLAPIDLDLGIDGPFDFRAVTTP